MQNKLEGEGFSKKQRTLQTDLLRVLEKQIHGIDVAIQLVVKGSKFEMFLHFRDRLINDPKLVNEYNEMKMRCAGMIPDDYRKVKAGFIERVLGE